MPHLLVLSRDQSINITSGSWPCDLVVSALQASLKSNGKKVHFKTKRKARIKDIQYMPGETAYRPAINAIASVTLLVRVSASTPRHAQVISQRLYCNRVCHAYTARYRTFRCKIPPALLPSALLLSPLSQDSLHLWDQIAFHTRKRLPRHNRFYSDVGWIIGPCGLLFLQ